MVEVFVPRRNGSVVMLGLSNEPSGERFEISDEEVARLGLLVRDLVD